MQSAKKLLTALDRDRAVKPRVSRRRPWSRSPTPPSRRTCTLVSARGRTLEIDYVHIAPAALTPAEDPYGIVHHAGEWYVVGRFATKRGDVRTFRIDRIAALRPVAVAVRFERPQDFDLEAYRRERLYVPSADAVTVRVRLVSLAVTRIGASWPVGEVTMMDDGSAELIIDCEGFEWVTGWVLGLGRHAWIVGPVEARRAMRDRIARLRAELNDVDALAAPYFGVTVTPCSR